MLLIDLAGYSLSSEDCELLAHPAVSGIVLFSRNYESIPQLTELTRSIRVQQPEVKIMVDQEGGRVQRFREGFSDLPAMGEWGQRYQQDPEATRLALYETIQTMARELHAVGVDWDFMPVLDIDHGISEIIGDRSFSGDPAVVIALGEVVIAALASIGFSAVGKHFPGHGAVVADSHVAAPVDTRTFSEIAALDLLPFQQLAPQLGAIMPAHVIYSAVDDKPAGFSRYWIQDILRDKLQFRGKVVSDCLSMAAAAAFGSYVDRAYAALEAGCDWLCVCNDRAGAVSIMDTASQLVSACGGNR